MSSLETTKLLVRAAVHADNAPSQRLLARWGIVPTLGPHPDPYVTVAGVITIACKAGWVMGR